MEHMHDSDSSESSPNPQSPQVETKSKQVGKADPIHNSILREIPALI